MPSWVFFFFFNEHLRKLFVACLADGYLKCFIGILFSSNYLNLTILDPGRFQDSWRLSDGFVAAEAKTILPHRARSR